MDSTAVSALIVFVMAITLVMLPFEASTLRRRATDKPWAMGWITAMALAFFNIVIALCTGAAVFYAVLFGPSYVTGDFIGLPWLTAMPALILGFLSAKVSSQAFLKLAFDRLARCTG